jgi:hypothetical protein
MKIAVIVLTLAAIPAVAAASEAQFRYKCEGDKLFIAIKVPKAGGYLMSLPANVCGPSV